MAVKIAVLAGVLLLSLSLSPASSAAPSFGDQLTRELREAAFRQEENRALYSLEEDDRSKRAAPTVNCNDYGIGAQVLGYFQVYNANPSRSGKRYTCQYTAVGTYNAAVNNFYQLNPTNVVPIRGRYVQGLTGLVGDIRVTVRNGSSPPSRPTLEIRNTIAGGYEIVRKFRYEPLA